MPGPFQIGVEVVIYRGYAPQPASLSRVSKIHKNGNVVLEGDPQQYRVSGDWGSATGGGYGRPSIRIATDDRKAELRLAQLRSQIDDLVRRLDVRKLTEERLTELRDLLLIISAEVKNKS